MKHVVLRVDGAACRVISGPNGQWIEHDDAGDAKAAARAAAAKDGVPIHRFVVVAVLAEARAAQDERGVSSVVERDW